ncbi:gluconate:H+ symporter, GntP family protein [Sphaerisporangium krabiense]|uniref:GntP family gluconate:H+ symporter n=1 Tax=Sphaerisporangium krabiense TaxID=763782 RepID=A0A7W8ZCD5_9ACTN|nr:SLC13 family permease [Sphaerisporangium krabiense]MBB5631397.1 GntP family gluconate:H+ symporter [Sphaerisporangium krabiense]GII60815.1 gluconate:H+ symporter, GntP family protein [Sphaerisporangium krabiense]
MGTLEVFAGAGPAVLSGRAACAGVLGAAPQAAAGSAGRLVVAVLAGIALIVVAITWARLHAFVSLALGALVAGAVAGLPMGEVIESFSAGFGDTAAGVGTLIALGAMFGGLLAGSGGAETIVGAIVARSGRRSLPWAMAGVGALIGLPMFFEIGLVLLMPVVFLVARRSGLPLVRVGLPALAGLSAMHGLVPPHPGPLVAVDALKADLGITLGLGVVVAVPVVVLAGPVLSRHAARWVPVTAAEVDGEAGAERSRARQGVGARAEGSDGAGASGGAGLGGRGGDAGPGGAGVEGPREDGAVAGGRRPSLAVTLATVLLPVVLMMGKAVADLAPAQGSPVRVVLDFAGTPLVALLVAVLVAVFTFGVGAGLDRAGIAGCLERSLGPVAGVLLVVAAGGGFKQTLVDSGIGTLVAGWAREGGVPVVVLAWLVAVSIRLVTGSATVATVTASGIVAPLVAGLAPAQTSLVVLAVGAGSLFFSHVNDAGFWLVKEYLGVSVGQTVRTWSVMESVISVAGLVLVLGLAAVL